MTPHPIIVALSIASLAGAGSIAAQSSSAADMQDLRAALEGRLSRIQSLEVRYRWQREALSERYQDLEGETTVHWRWRDGRESFWSDPSDMLVEHGWYYDGSRTYLFGYSPTETEDPPRVSIWPGPPRTEDLYDTHYAYLLGLRMMHTNRGLAGFLDPSIARYADPPQLAHGFSPYVFFGRHDGLFVPFDLWAVIKPDGQVPAYTYRRVGMENVTNNEFWESIVVAETREFDDPLFGGSMSLPVRARWETPEMEMLSRFEVDELRVNHDLPDELFRPEIPFGARVREEPAVAGGSAREYLAGGEAAIDQALQRQEQLIAAELSRLAADGVTYDARPPAGWNWGLWLSLGGALLLIVAVATRLSRSGSK